MSESKREEIEVKAEAYGDGWFDGFNSARTLLLSFGKHPIDHSDEEIIALSEEAQEAYRLVNLKCVGLNKARVKELNQVCNRDQRYFESLSFNNRIKQGLKRILGPSSK